MPASRRGRAVSRSHAHRRCIRSPDRDSTRPARRRARPDCPRHAARAIGDDDAAAIRAAGASIGWRASRSRTDLSACSATIFRCCAGRAGWRSLCSTPFRRRNERSRAPCCSAFAEKRARVAQSRFQKACHFHHAARKKKVACASRTTFRGTVIIRSRRRNCFPSFRPFFRTSLVRIGHHVIGNNLVVAPMAGVTDRPFRQLCKRLGALRRIGDGGLQSAVVVTENHSAGPITGEVGPLPCRLRVPIPRRWPRPALQRRARRADHRHQHGLPGEEGVQRRGGSALPRTTLVEAIVAAVACSRCPSR